MGLDKIQVDTQLLRDSGHALSTIESEFTNANQHSDVLAEAVGDDQLADRVRNFTKNWDQHRKELVEQIGSLKKIILDGADNLESADSQLADKLTATPTPRGLTR